MGCWYCHWGWPEPIAKVYLDAVRKLGGHTDPLHFGPSHSVWEDENFDLAQQVLDNWDEYMGYVDGARYSDEELGVIKWSLVELSKVPIEIREIGLFDDGDPDDASLFPPPEGMVMVRVHPEARKIWDECHKGILEEAPA